ncbi:MAG: peptide chain release factor 2 [Candidatus Zixiibacteriota bacterium]|nr:MAG: peptide chain release factor 2 [candidate division Zixibacteria bacterium]
MFAISFRSSKRNSINLRGIFDLAGRIEKTALLEKKTTEPNFWDDNQAAQAILKEISVHKKWVDSHQRLVSDLKAVEELLEMADLDESSDDATEIVSTFEGLLAEVEKFEFSSLLSGPDDYRDAIVTIHPGAGGTESQDWADMLFRMYNRWSERRDFSVELMDYQPGEEAGLKSAVMKVKGEFAYGFLKAESGVHRLVRISPFDANSRRHTSFVSVHIYPVVEDSIEIEIKDDDIRIDTFRASGAGGQHVNKTSSAVRITHIPSGIVVSCQSERSQHKNKDAAFTVLKARLYQLKKEEEAKKMHKFEKSKKKIEWGSQIRSYVFHPYNMVKDHRTSVETSNVQAVMDGDIDQFIEAYLSDPDFKEQSVES